MDNETKKPRLHDYNGESNLQQSLLNTCNWNFLDNVAIEYYTLEKVIAIKYSEIDAARLRVSDILEDIKNFEFIGISSDVIEYCIPSLMLGILARSHAFVYLPSELSAHKKLLVHLQIKYMFVQRLISDADVICNFEIHNEQIHLVKVNRERKECSQNILNRYAYAISTSGSTGTSKIVKVPHSCILPNIKDLQTILSVTVSDRIAQLTSLTFDPSIVEIFLSLSSASTLCMTCKELRNATNRLLTTMFRKKVTILQSTPSLFLHRWSAQCLRTTLLSEKSCLRILLLGGEPFPKIELFSKVRHPKNRTELFNIYGITEVSCWASINKIPWVNVALESSRLGKPLSETILQVRDENGTILHKGEGLLYIGSRTRVCAINNEVLKNTTDAVFRDSGDIVKVDDNGQIYYKARKDDVIKRYGNKVNLQELNRIVAELSFVLNCYACWDEHTHKLHLCISTINTVTDVVNLKNDVMTHVEKLPAFYKPDEIHFVEYFELTANDKVCTRFLQRICEKEVGSRESLENIKPKTSRDTFESIWMNYMKCKAGGFVKSGGTSIVALQISVSVSEAYRAEFPELIGMLLKDATFEECLMYILNNLSLSTHDDVKMPVVSSKDKLISNENLSTTESAIRRLHTTDGKYLWYKCKGKLYDYLAEENQVTISNVNTIPSIKVQDSYDLLKCVDASPSIFQYVDETFVTVGSHSGIICTIELTKQSCHSLVYKVTLPDRIEASVLILKDFKGIIGCYDGCIYCIHLKSGKIFWKYQTNDIVKCTAILCQSQINLFVGSYDCNIYCLSAKTGFKIWSVETNDGSVSASGCLHRRTGTVLFGTLGGSCLALQQSTGKIIWRHKLEHPIFVAPITLKNGLVIFCSVAGMICCFDIQTDLKIWTYVIDSNIFSYPISRYDSITKCENIIFACMSKNIYSLKLSSTNVKSEPILTYILNAPSSIFATPWCEDDLMFVACTDGSLCIYRFLEGESVTSIKLPGDIFSSPVVHGTRIAVGCRDNNLYVLNFSSDTDK